MEAMTQEFMLHRRPHAEIWSAREGSDDDTSKIHRRHKTSDGSQTMSTKNNRSTSEIWWISTNYSQSQIPQNWEKKPNHKPPPSYTSETKSDKAQPHHMSIWVHIRDTRRCSNNKRLTASNTHLKTIKTWTKHRCSSLDPITHPIRNRRLRQILTARILRRQKSRRRNGKP